MDPAMESCAACEKTAMNYCWEGRELDCPLALPPRWIADGAPGVLGLWRMLRAHVTKAGH